jgi:hypothetical protein
MLARQGLFPHWAIFPIPAGNDSSRVSEGLRFAKIQLLPGKSKDSQRSWKHSGYLNFENVSSWWLAHDIKSSKTNLPKFGLWALAFNGWNHSPALKPNFYSFLLAIQKNLLWPSMSQIRLFSIYFCVQHREKQLPHGPLGWDNFLWPTLY